MTVVIATFTQKLERGDGVFTVVIDRKSGNVTVQCLNPEGVWKFEDYVELQKYNIIYNGGIVAALITPRKNADSLITLGIEDDGRITFTETDMHFSTFWINNLRNVLDKVQEKLKGKNDVDCN